VVPKDRTGLADTAVSLSRQCLGNAYVWGDTKKLGGQVYGVEGADRWDGQARIPRPARAAPSAGFPPARSN